MTGVRNIDSERLARAVLCAVVEPSRTSVGELVAEHGAQAVVEELRAVLPPGRIDIAREAMAGALARTDARFVVPDDSEWPPALDDLGDEAPHGLWLRGEASLREAVSDSVAVVGARAASDYGIRMASVMSGDLAARGWCVVSGGAYGIDAAAHRGALADGGTTVVILACGIDCAYPSAHGALFDRCAENGLIVSEAAPGEPARRWRFLDRNRLIAALAPGTVVVEAARRSGALATARRAADLGRVVMGVPGPVTSGASGGVHAMLRSGDARLVTCADEVIDDLESRTEANGSAIMVASGW